MPSEVKPFWQWKQELRTKEAPIVRPKDHYYVMYGRYVAKQRLNNRNKIA